MKCIQKVLSDSAKQASYLYFVLILLALFVHGISFSLYARLENPNFLEIAGIYYILFAFCFDIIYLFYIPENFCFLQFFKLFFCIPLSRFTDIYIYEFYHLIIQYCTGIFWYFETVLHRNQKELCDYVKLFEYKKNIEEQEKNRIVNLISYCTTLIVFLEFPLVTRKIVESAIFFVPTFYIQFRSLFFVSLYNCTKNKIPFNEDDFKALEAMENPIPCSSIVLPVLTAILITTPSWISCVIVFFGVAIVFIQDLWHFENMRINGIEFYKKIILLFCAIGVVYFLYCLTQKMGGGIDQNNLPGLIIPVISAVFIFNFSAICYLVQENYHKYNSVLLIKESLNFTTILFAIIVPAGFVLLLIFYDANSSNLLFWCVTATAYSLGSSIWLLFRIRFLLNERKIILRLMARLSKDDIKDYCQNLNINSENSIDTMQKVLTLIIKNDDVNLAEDCFSILFRWIALNLDCIHETSDIYWKIQQNRFNKFLIGLSQVVSKADNYVMRQNFSYSMYEAVLLKSDIKQIKRYEIIYLTLESFIKNELEKDDRYSEKVAENAFHIMVSMVPKYLHYMECNECPFDEFSYLNESEDYHRFNEIVINSVNECINFAIDNKKIDFLKSTYLITRMFREYEEPFSIPSDDNKFLWNDNAYRCLQEITHIYYRIYTSLFVEDVLRHIEIESRQFAHLISELNYSTPVQRAIFNSFYNSYCTFIAKMLENKRLFSGDEFFETVCEPVFNKCSCQAYFNAYMELFFKTTKQILDLYSENEELLKADDLMRIVGRIMQIKEHLQQQCEFKFEKSVLEKFDEYEKAYHVIYKNYVDYEKKQKVFYLNYKKAVKHI